MWRCRSPEHTGPEAYDSMMNGMSAPDINQELLENFKPLVGDAHLTSLLGVGASAPSGLPDWNEFAPRVAVLSGLVETESAANILLSRQDPTIVLPDSRRLADWL